MQYGCGYSTACNLFVLFCATVCAVVQTMSQEPACIKHPPLLDEILQRVEISTLPIQTAT